MRLAHYLKPWEAKEMGEYATYLGESIKIGTCEDMYYLRWDQAQLVRAESGSVDPIRDRGALRFRFPFPDEDDVEPGQFRDHERSLPLYDMTVPEGVEHNSIQLVQSYPHAGYLLSVPCPMGPNAVEGLTFHKNGWGGDVRLVQQAWRGGLLVAICECGGCGARYNLPTFDDVEPAVVALRAEADRAQREASYAEPIAKRAGRACYYDTIADRITAGYAMTDAELVTR